MENKEKKTSYTILDNTLDWYCTDEAYEYYKEWCEMNNIEPAEKDSSEYWNWVYEEVDDTIDCDLMNMEYSKIKDRTFVITGAVQLWNCRPTIKPVFMRGACGCHQENLGQRRPSF